MREWIYYMIIACVILLALICFFSRNRALRDKKAAQRKLEDTLSSLEAVYSEVNTTQEELNTKYRELKASEDKIKKLAYEDAMTGLPNQAAFQEVLEHTTETLRKDESIAIMYLDLDNFKAINDMWGRACGDELILDVSHRLKQNLDENDYLARSGSDEFLILTQNIGEIDVYEEKVKRIEKAFRFPFVLSVGEFVITVSLGVAIGPRDGRTAAVLLKRVDVALSQAKWIGKNTYCYYTEALEQKRLEDMELRTELTAAMKQDEFFLLYEPVDDWKTGSVRGLRIRLCWDRKEKGVWQSGKFIRFAEETGQILALGDRMFRKSCKDQRLWPAELAACPILVPLCARQLFYQGFEQNIMEILKEEKAPLDRFLFEINESVLVENFEDSKLRMDELAGRGFRFRIGEFGGGRMSFDCVRELPAEQVAVSLNHILDNQEAEEAQAYLRIVVNAVLEMGKQVVITGIADAEEERLAGQWDNVLVQGDLYGAPVPAKEVGAKWENAGF